MRTHCVPIPFAEMVEYQIYSKGFDLVLPYNVRTVCCDCLNPMRLRGAPFMYEDDAPDGLLCADCANTATLSWWDKHRGDKTSISWSYIGKNIYFVFSDIRQHVISQRIVKKWREVVIARKIRRRRAVAVIADAFIAWCSRPGTGLWYMRAMVKFEADTQVP